MDEEVGGMRVGTKCPKVGDIDIVFCWSGALIRTGWCHRKRNICIGLEKFRVPKNIKVHGGDAQLACAGTKLISLLD